jgi:hypothetical protein
VRSIKFISALTGAALFELYLLYRLLAPSSSWPHQALIDTEIEPSQYNLSQQAMRSCTEHGRFLESDTIVPEKAI